MAVVEPGSPSDSARRRHPRLVRRTAWLQRHSLSVTITAAALIGFIFVIDAAVHPVTMAGFYLIPLMMLALTARAQRVAVAGIVCGLLTVLVFVWQDTLTASYLFNLLYGGLAGLGLVLAAYLIRRLATISDYAILRAQLAEAGADILSGGTRDDLDELLQYALERMGEQLEATGGAVLLLEDGAWRGRAGFGLGVDAGEVHGARDEAPLAAEVLRVGGVAHPRLLGLRRRHPRAAHGAPAPGARAHRPHARARPRDRRHGLQPAGGQRRLRRGPDRRGRERGPLPRRGRRQRAPHDRAQHQAPRPGDGPRRQSRLRPEPRPVGGAGGAWSRACSSALGMHACDIFEVDEDSGALRIVVSYDDQSRRHRRLERTRSSPSTTSPRSPRRSPRSGRSSSPPGTTRPSTTPSAELLMRHGHRTQVTIPLWIRERVLAVIQLYDVESRQLRRRRRSSSRGPSAASPRWPWTRRGCSSASASRRSAATGWRAACSACSRSPST